MYTGDLCWSIRLSVYSSISQAIHPSVYSSISQAIHPSVYSSISLFIHLSGLNTALLGPKSDLSGPKICHLRHRISPLRLQISALGPHVASHASNQPSQARYRPSQGFDATLFSLKICPFRPDISSHLISSPVFYRTSSPSGPLPKKKVGYTAIQLRMVGQEQ